MKSFKFLVILALSIFTGLAQATDSSIIGLNTDNLQNGDLIFQNHMSQQSGAIEEVQGNPWTHVGVLYMKNKKWYVLEAVGPVTITPLAAFIRSGKNRVYEVKRVNPEILDMSHPKAQEKLYKEFTKYRGIKYDLFFQWSNERIYCSELVYKMFDEAFGVKVGPLVQIKDLDLSGPLAQELVKAREELLGGPANLEENIVTPGAQHDDPQLVSVEVD